MIKIKTIAFSLMYIALSSAYAQSRNGDSVIEKDKNILSSMQTTNNGKVKVTAYKPLSNVEYDNKPCPSGYYGSSGGSTYKSRQRLTSKMYETNYLSKTINGDWDNTNDYCTRYQTQEINCPSGQEGYRRQEKTDVYNNNGYDLGTWVTTSRNCSPIPPPPPPPPVYTPPPPVYNPPPVYIQPPPPPPVTQTPPPVVTCKASMWDDSFACPSGFTGIQSQMTYNTCPNGPYGAMSTTYGPVLSECTPIYTPPPPPPAPPPYTPPVYQNPPPSGCYDIYGGYITVGTVMSVCNATGTPDGYPKGKTMRCSAQGWVVQSPGNPKIQMDCM